MGADIALVPAHDPCEILIVSASGLCGRRQPCDGADDLAELKWLLYPLRALELCRDDLRVAVSYRSA